MKGRVLIIDDEAEIRRNLTVGLAQEGYTAVACPDGISAIHELDSASGRENGRAAMPRGWERYGVEASNATRCGRWSAKCRGAW